MDSYVALLYYILMFVGYFTAGLALGPYMKKLRGDYDEAGQND